jgi:hypothetical protein
MTGKMRPSWAFPAAASILASIVILTAQVPMARIYAAVPSKKAKVKPSPAPREQPDDPNYLKGTNIPVRTEAPAPGSS